MTTAYYYGENLNRAQLVLEQWKSVVDRWVPWSQQSEQRQLWQDQPRIFLLFSPLKINGTYLSPERVWKRYLGQELPDCVFLVAGFRQLEDPNYLDVLNLPEDPVLFLEQAKTAGEDWPPQFTGGMDVAHQLERFHEGHGAESVIDILGLKIQSTLQTLQEQLDQGNDYQHVWGLLDIETVVISTWRNLLTRWKNYLPLFKCLPFYDDLKKADQLFQQIHPFFQSEGQSQALFESLECIQVLDQILNLLSESVNYVYE